MLCENHYLISAFFPSEGKFATSLGKFCALVREIFLPSKGTKTGRRREKLMICKLLYMSLVMVAFYKIVRKYLGDNRKLSMRLQ